MFNKLKIINDPVYGLINLENELLFDIIEHPLFQRLRRITQLGLAYYVYPGATHTRFQHALGATYLMQKALDVLNRKGVLLTKQERTAALTAILLHDIGHGPFSHTLEYNFFCDICHEQISLLFMQSINKDMHGALDEGISVFTNSHPKKILHQLVSSQLDMDRLDYLNRDSFFTGVSEGIVGSERIIEMLTEKNGNLAVEAKGIYSIEKFLIARRLMYWQVYLHKTVVVAEQILKKIISRARLLIRNGQNIYAPPALEFFLKNDKKATNTIVETPLKYFAMLDDHDIFSAMKIWRTCGDFVLENLCSRLLDRKLFKIEISNSPVSEQHIAKIRQQTTKNVNIPEELLDYFVIYGNLENNAYIKSPTNEIKILRKDQTLNDIAEESDISNISALSKKVKKHFIIYPI